MQGTGPGVRSVGAQDRKCTGYTVWIRRSLDTPGLVNVRLDKTFWQVRVGISRRVVAETSFIAETLPEHLLLEETLLELLRALADRQA